mgnify:CR=1 FL=1
MLKGIMCTMKQQLIYCPTMKWSGQMMSVEKLRGNMGIGSFEIAASCGCLWAHVTFKPGVEQNDVVIETFAYKFENLDDELN